jgi:hypothetical protein
MKKIKNRKMIVNDSTETNRSAIYIYHNSRDDKIHSCPKMQKILFIFNINLGQIPMKTLSIIALAVLQNKKRRTALNLMRLRNNFSIKEPLKDKIFFMLLFFFKIMLTFTEAKARRINTSSSPDMFVLPNGI